MFKVLVVGDSIIDEYVHGEASRVSPEGPFLVLDVDPCIIPEFRLGGACNVAANIKSLNRDSVEVDYLGAWSEQLKLMLDSVGVNLIKEEGLKVDNSFMLKKTRLCSHGRQILRLDSGKFYSIDFVIYNFLVNVCKNYDAIVISDYDKRTISDSEWIDISSANFSCLVFADIKRDRDLHFDRNKFILKCNKKEFDSFSNCRNFSVVTLGEKGCMWIDNNLERHYVESWPSQVVDTVGAGDVFLACMVSHYLSNGKALDFDSMCRFANEKCSESVKSFGTTVVF
jgi:D-beta-D-heptose 7-phosphate kinase/D-beta-D-heptose 1-phosphate adenosyltransferase